MSAGPPTTTIRAMPLVSEQPQRLRPPIGELGLPSGGAIRASFGLGSNFADLHRFSEFAREFVDLSEVPADLPRRLAC